MARIQAAVELGVVGSVAPWTESWLEFFPDAPSDLRAEYEA